MTPNDRFDLFVSYAEPDRWWVEGFLLDALNEAGVRFHTESAFQLGVPRVEEFERAIRKSDRTLLVLSPAFAVNDAGQFFKRLAQQYGADSHSWPVIPLLLKPIVNPDPSLSMLTGLDATVESDWPGVIRRLCHELKRPVPQTSVRPPCPFPGMRAFRSSESLAFFGREAEIRTLIEHHLRIYPFVAIIGGSGTGKSSLVFAGLVPELQRSPYFGSGSWVVKSVRPGAKPLEAMQMVFGDQWANPGEWVARLLRMAQEGSQPDADRLLLIVDQFEEVFTLAAESAEVDRAAFVGLLIRLSQTQSCYVVVTVRADFYADLMREPALWSQICSHRLELTALSSDGLRAAIVRPAEAAGVQVEPALVERLLSDSGAEPGILPFLQETLLLLWGRIERRCLPASVYDDIVKDARRAAPETKHIFRTGLDVAMASRADHAMNALESGDARSLARRVLLRLVQFGEGRADTRRQQSVSQLRSAGEDPQLFDATLKHLIEARLLTTSGEEGRSVEEAAIDIAHEALLTGWPTLIEWINLRRDAEQTRRWLRQSAEKWLQREAAGQRAGLLDEVELHEAERWRDRYGSLVGQDAEVEKLIAGSRCQVEQRRREREEQTRRELEQLRMIAQEAERRAEVERLYASEQRRLRLQGVSLYLSAHVKLGTEDRERAALLAREAYLLNDESGGAACGQVYQGLAATLEQPDIRLALRAHRQYVDRLCLSNEGALLASGDREGSVRIWDLSRLSVAHYSEPGTSSRSEQIHKFEYRVQSMCFSTDSRTLGVLAHDGDLWLFAVSPGSTGARVIGARTGFAKGDAVLMDAVNVLVYDSEKQEFALDGNEYARASARRIISERGLNVPLYTTFRGGRPLPYTTVASPDGTLLLVRSAYPSDQRVELWKLDSQQHRKHELLTGAALQPCFTSDSKKLFVGSRGWDTNWPPQPLPPLTLESADRQPTSLAIDGLATTVAMGHWEGEIWLWRDQPDSATRKCDSLPKPFESSCFDVTEGGMVGWAEDGRAVLHRARRDGSGVALSTVPKALFETGHTATERLAYEIWRYRDRGGDDERNWRDAAFVLRIRQAAQQLFERSGRILRLLHIGATDYALAAWPGDPTHPPALLSFSGELQGVPLALGQASDGSILIASSTTDPESHDPFGAQVVNCAVYRVASLDRQQLLLEKISSGKRSILWALFSPDGRFVLTQDRPDQGAPWRPKRADSLRVSMCRIDELDQKPHDLSAGSDIICSAAAFSRDGRKLALAFSQLVRSTTIRAGKPAKDAASKILLFDTTDRDPKSISSRPLRGDVTAIAFSREGDTLAVGASNGDVDLIDLKVERSTPIGVGEFGTEIRSLFFDTYRSLLSIDANGTVRSTVTDGSVLADAVCERVSQNLSEEDWDYFIGSDIPYRYTCPGLPKAADLKRK